MNMKKIYFLLIALCSLNVAGFAQVVVNEGFEESGSFPPPGWTVGGTTTTGIIAAASCARPYPCTAPHGGSYYADWESYSISSGNEYLITPVIDWSARGGAATNLTIWFYRDGGSYQGDLTEGVTAYVNTSPSLTGAVSMGFVPRASNVPISGGVTGTSTPGTGTSGWYQYTFSIPNTYNGSTNYIIFNFTTQYGDDCYMDDVQYTAYPSPSVATSPTSLAFGAVVVGTTSPAQVFSLSGTALSGAPLTVTAPAGFQLSLTSVGTYTPSLSVSYPANTLTVTPVYVQFAPTFYATVTSSVTVTGGGLASTYNEPVSGTGQFPCSGTPSIGTASVSPTSGGGGTTFSLSIPAITSVGGIAYQWQQFTAGSGSYFTNIPGATTATYSLTTGISSDTYFRCVVTCTYSGSSVISNTVLATLSPAGTCSGIPTPGSIGYDVASGCAPSYVSNMYYTSPGSTSGGLYYQWQSSPDNTTWSNISGATGSLYSPTVTATTWYRVQIICISSGGIAYTSGQQLVFNPLPTPITGNLNVCTASPNTLSSTPSGGTWISSNTSTVNIGLGTGVATAISPGTSIITYTAPTGCTAITQVSANVSPAAITGASNVCAGSTISLSDVIPGGVWTSNNALFATAGSSTGVVSGVAPGTAMISYTLANGCSSVNPITINPVPLPISGPSNVCPNATVTLSDATAGGTWSSSNSFQASVSISGVVSGMMAGTPSIMYTLPTGCMATLPMTVNPLPAAISGSPYVCAGGFTTLSDAGGGTWSVSPISLATVGATSGVVSGITAGSVTVTYTLPGTGCMITSNMTVAPKPTAYNVTVTNGGGYCPGGTGVHVGLNGSQSGVNYYLYLASSEVDSLPGTSSGLDYGLKTAVGTYTVQAVNTLTGCASNMSGSANVFISSPPTPYIVGGGGNYCAGGAGLPITLSNSTSGVSYQLLNGLSNDGPPVAGNGLPINFGLKTAPGTYTVSARNTTTGCTSNMSGSATITIIPDPVSTYSITAPGGSSYCSGGTGVGIQLTSSDPGVVYRLYKNNIATSDSLAGAGIGLNFGNQTDSGIYTIMARDATTGCRSAMTGTVNVTVNPLPRVYALTGGGNYCAGGAGSHVGLTFSDIGTSYTLFRNGVSTGITMPGASSSIDFGPQAAVGTYSVSAMITATGCTSNMTGTVSVGVNSLPNTYTVSAPGGSSYCSGGTGVGILLSGSDAGISYQLYNSGVLTGPAMTGGSGALNFGLHTAPGNYTIVATNTTTLCSQTMTGTIPVTVNALPAAFTVGGGGNYCSGGTGSAVTLGGSSAGVSYRLSLLGSPFGTAVAGTGSGISMGLQTTAGVYTIIGTDTATGCTRTMNGNAIVGVNPAPAASTVTGGGVLCAGGAGVHVGLGLSATGISYQLKRSGSTVATLLGTGLPLDFGLQTTGGSYTVLATNTSTGCTANMTGSATVIVNPLPTVFSVMGGGAFCAGAPGVHDSLSGSQSGVNYQLYNGSTGGTTIAGTGLPLDFGPATASGTYTVKATDAVTGCTNTMAASASVTVNPTPAVFNVSGGGSYCASTGGEHIYLSGSDLLVQYQVWLGGGTAVGTPWSGTGSSLDLGADTAGGMYTVTATNPLTHCSSMMSGSATITVIPSVVPNVSITTSSPMGDTVCAGTRITFTAVPVNGGTAPVYQWKVGGVTVGSGPNYSYVPANNDNVSVSLTSDAACALPASVNNSITIRQMAAQTPAVTIAMTPGSSICPGTSVSFTATPVYGGTAPSYTWMLNGDSVSTGNMYSYTPNDSDYVFAIMNSNYSCVTSGGFAISNDYVIRVNSPIMPVFSLLTAPGTTVAAGASVIFTAQVDNAFESNPTYQWTKNGRPITGATNASYTTSALSNDDVICAYAAGNNSCGTSSPAVHCETMTILPNTGVQQVAGGESDIRVMPNPNTGLFTVKGSTGVAGDQDVALEVTNMLGQVVYSGTASAHNGMLNSQVRLDGSLANGMYLLNVRFGNESKTFHFVVEQ